MAITATSAFSEWRLVFPNGFQIPPRSDRRVALVIATGDLGLGPQGGLELFATEIRLKLWKAPEHYNYHLVI